LVQVAAVLWVALAAAAANAALEQQQHPSEVQLEFGAAVVVHAVLCCVLWFLLL
jgi:hypothetical protein